MMMGPGRYHRQALIEGAPQGAKTRTVLVEKGAAERRACPCAVSEQPRLCTHSPVVDGDQTGMSQNKINGAGVALLAVLALAGETAQAAVKEGPISDQKISLGNGGGGPTGVQVVGDFHIIHIDGFKGAPKRIAISAFNVAFPNEKFQSAETSRTEKFHTISALGTRYLNTVRDTKSESQHTAIQGVDQATRQRIADAAYADFVEQLTKAGYEVVGADALAKLTPEYASWTAQPNFTQGRYGAYVAPTGRRLFFLRSDSAKGDSQGNLSKMSASFQGFDSPQAFQRSPYIARDGKLGVIAVTLVVDYGTYVNSGNTTKYNAAMEVGFSPGVTAQSGSFYDTATLLEYWGPASGGFPAVAALAAPLTSDLPFGKTIRGGDGEVTMQADPALFEKAAAEVTQAADARLIGAFTAAAAR
jgi:hypothetical protein